MMATKQTAVYNWEVCVGGSSVSKHVKEVVINDNVVVIVGP